MSRLFTPRPFAGDGVGTPRKRLLGGFPNSLCGSTLFSICLLLWVGKIQAGTEYYARLWQTENGLPNSIVQAIAQTSDGYLWLGTREGLCRFDGEQFEVVTLVPQSIEPSINSLMAAHDGSLWVGTDGLGVFRLSGDGFQHLKAPERDHRFTVFQICESATGSIWFDTDAGILQWSDGVMRWRPDLASGQNAVPSKNWKTELWSNRNPICSDGAGGVWVLNGNLIRADVPTPTNYFAEPDLLPYSGRTMLCDEEGGIWIGTDSSADNVVIKVKDGVITKYARQKGPAGFPQVVFRDRAGGLWVGSYEGLSRLIEDQFVPYTQLDNSCVSTTFKIHAIFEDQENNLWVGSDGGLTRLTPKHFTTFTKADGLASDTVLAVCPGQDGGVWISSWGSGLNHYVDGEIRVLSTSNGLPSNFVMALAVTRDGSVWTGVDYNGPLIRIKDGKINVYNRAGYHGTPVLYEDERGILWIGNRGGLQTWNGTKFDRYSTKNGLSDDGIDAICGGENGVVWIGTKSGLTRWQAGKFEDLGATNPDLRVSILSLHHDKEGVLWIGTRRKGLLRYRDGLVREFTQKNGLFSDSIYAILEDQYTNFWFNSSRGIFRMNKRQLEAAAESEVVTCVTYGRSDGILASSQHYDATHPAACTDSQGRLWFRTTQGVVMVDPATISSNDRPPPLVIQEVIANNRVVATSSLGVSVPSLIEIPPGNGALEIRYAALSYRAPERNIYRYKLEGVESEWINAGRQRVVKYNNLRPGRYRFQVMASNNDGLWSKEGQIVELFFKPHFWQTWWFLVTMGIVAMGVVGGTARSITRRRMQRKLNELEKQQAIEHERSRIARDVHDELGAKLTSISFLGSIASRSLENPAEIQKQIDQMSASAREAVSSLHGIVWAVDPANDSLEGLIAHISHQLGELFGNSSIHCEVKVPDQIPDLHLSANVRHNLFSATMEAANNAAKHSRAAQVIVQISADPGSLKINVSDDGCGWKTDVAGGRPKDKHGRYGNGLVNIQKRLHSIGGTSDFSSDTGKGTVIRLTVPLTETGQTG